MALKTQRFILRNSLKLSPSVKQFSFVPEEGACAAFNPGQFITLHLTDKNQKKQFRSYSLCNLPKENTQYEIAVSYIPGGLASEHLFHLQPGSTIELSGPHGLFVLKPNLEEKRIILVGTGTGISPYRSMLGRITDWALQQDRKVIVIQGVRKAEDLLFPDDFIQADKNYQNFQFIACYSQADKEPLDSFALKGRVQLGLDQVKPDPKSDIIYLCGHPKMIDDNYTILQALGFDRYNLKREKYNFSH